MKVTRCGPGGGSLFVQVEDSDVTIRRLREQLDVAIEALKRIASIGEDESPGSQTHSETIAKDTLAKIGGK